MVEFASYWHKLPERILAGSTQSEGEVLLGLWPEHFFDTRLVSADPDRSSFR